MSKAKQRAAGKKDFKGMGRSSGGWHGYDFYYGRKGGFDWVLGIGFGSPNRTLVFMEGALAHLVLAAILRKGKPAFGIGCNEFDVELRGSG